MFIYIYIYLFIYYVLRMLVGSENIAMNKAKWGISSCKEDTVKK